MPGAVFSQVIDVKLLPPRPRPETIHRRRVRRLLDAAAGARVTLVCAPAGYGKTTALADWFGTLDQRVWISLDRDDNDPRRLCAHLLAALDQLWPAATWPAQQALRGGSELVGTVVPLIADAIARELTRDGLTIVLDDLHLLVSDAGDRFLKALIERLPEGARLVLASRTRPRLRLARERAANLLAELSAAQLAFSPDETERLLNGALRLRLPREQVDAIQAHVEGWPAGLSLVAATLRRERDVEDVTRALARSREPIAEYLVQEVLDALPARMRGFLTRTSILGRMTAPLCEAVTGDPGAPALLDAARRGNLFLVTLDDGGCDDWVRYHGLFAELLRRELRRGAPDELPRLHRRAARWFAGAAMPEEAIDHAIAAGDGVLAAEILRDHWWQLVDGARRSATVRELIARMPAERGELGPFCAVVDAYCMAVEGADLRVVAGRLDALEAQRDAPGVAPILDSLRISPYYGDVPRALATGLRVWEEAAGDPALRHAQAGKLATVLWFAGERATVRREIEPYMGRVDRPALRSWELAARALCAADDGDLEAAERDGRAAVAIVARNGSESALAGHLAYVALAEALRRRGRLDEAHAQIANALRITARLPDSAYHALALVVGAQIELASRNRRLARRHAEAARRIADRHRDLGVLGERLALVERALAGDAGRPTGESEPTAAELRVLALLPTDLTRGEIAARLAISVGTVKTHTWRLYRRLGASSRAEAVERARERGLL